MDKCTNVQILFLCCQYDYAVGRLIFNRYKGGDNIVYYARHSRHAKTQFVRVFNIKGSLIYIL